MMNGLLKIPLFMPTEPSIPLSIIADVHMTMLSVISLFSQLWAVSIVSRR